MQSLSKKQLFFCFFGSAVVKETRQIAAVWGISISQTQLTPIQLHLIFSDVVFLACCHVSTSIFLLCDRDPLLALVNLSQSHALVERERKKKMHESHFLFCLKNLAKRILSLMVIIATPSLWSLQKHTFRFYFKTLKSTPNFLFVFFRYFWKQFTGTRHVLSVDDIILYGKTKDHRGVERR